MGEALERSTLPEKQSQTSRPSSVVVDFSQFQKAREVRLRNQASEIGLLTSDISLLDPYGEFYSDADKRAMLAEVTPMPPANKDKLSNIENQEAFTKKAQELLYVGLWIDTKLENNGTLKQFIKGIVDGAILWNIEFAEAVIRDPNKFVEAIKNIDFEKLWEGFVDSMRNLVSGDPYLAGKSLGELWLITTGWAIVVAWAKKVFKEGFKLAAKAAENAAKTPPVVSGSLRAQRGAIGDLNKGEKIISETAPPKIGEFLRSYDPLKNSPADNLNAIQHLNNHLVASEILETKEGIKNFTKSLKNLSKYVEGNLDQIGMLKESYVSSILELRKIVKSIADHPHADLATKSELEKLKVNLENTVYRIYPKIWPQQ